MYLFLITFISIYGGMHYYVFFKLRSIFLPKPRQTWLLILWLVVMTLIPVFVRIAEQFGMEQTALVIAWPGYLWMGFLFIFTSILLLTDIVNQFYHIIIRSFFKKLPESGYSGCVGKIALLVASVASVYAFFEAGHIKSEYVVIKSPKVPPSISRVRIVQISDMHIGLLSQEHRQRQILKKIRDAHPDIIVSTGDLIDGKLNLDYGLPEHTSLATLLASIPAPSGKFAVIGNHEVYAGLPQALTFTRAAGFKILRNQAIMFKNGITISGVDDRAAEKNPAAEPKIETAMLSTVSHTSFNILLKHRPEILPASAGLFDLQLSGHVHGGQIFPFNFLVKLRHQIPCGTTLTEAGSLIHVSRGTGTWGPPMRLFAPPEVTIIDVIP